VLYQLSYRVGFTQKYFLVCGCKDTTFFLCTKKKSIIFALYFK